MTSYFWRAFVNNRTYIHNRACHVSLTHSFGKLFYEFRSGARLLHHVPELLILVRAMVRAPRGSTTWSDEMIKSSWDVICCLGILVDPGVMWLVDMICWFVFINLCWLFPKRNRYEPWFDNFIHLHTKKTRFFVASFQVPTVVASLEVVAMRAVFFSVILLVLVFRSQSQVAWRAQVQSQDLGKAVPSYDKILKAGCEF